MRDPKAWQPPPRPPELRGVHIVDLNAERTEGVDYYALVSDRKSDSRSDKKIENSGVDKSSADKNRVLGSKPKPPSFTLNDDKTPLSAEPEKGLLENTWDQIKAYQKPLSAAAAVGFLFLSGYAVFIGLSGTTTREPASTAKSTDRLDQSKTTAGSATASKDLGTSNPSSLGTGANRKPLAHPPIIAAPVPTSPANEVSPNRDPPQYYSSSEETPSPIPQAVQQQFNQGNSPLPDGIYTAPQVPANLIPPPIVQQDPNAGLVQPINPNIMPPAVNPGTATY